jgi:hypothetical protein
MVAHGRTPASVAANTGPFGEPIGNDVRSQDVKQNRRLRRQKVRA